MKRNFTIAFNLCGILLLYTQLLFGQTSPLKCYSELLNEGDQLRDNRNYGEAINKYTAAFNCEHEAGHDVLRNRIQGVINLLELAKMKAENDERLAREKEQEVIIERDKALKEKKEKEAARDSASLYAKRAEALFLTAQSQILLDKNDISQDALLLSYAGLKLSDNESRVAAYTTFVKAAYRNFSGGIYDAGVTIDRFDQIPFFSKLLIQSGSKLLIQDRDSLPMILDSSCPPGSRTSVSGRPNQFVSWGYGPFFKLYYGENVRHREVKLHTQPVLSLTYSSDDKYVLSGGRDSTISITPTLEGNAITIREHKGNVYQIIPQPLSSQFLSRSSDGTIRLWNIDGVCNTVFYGSFFQAAVFSNDGKYIAAVDAGSRVIMWDALGVVVDTFEEPEMKDVKQIVFVKNEPKLLIVTDNKIFLADKGSGVKLIRQYWGEINGVMMNPSGDRFLTWTKKGELNCSDFHSTSNINLQYGNVSVMNASISPDNRYILSTTVYGTVVLHDIDGTKLYTWQADHSNPIAAQFSNDHSSVYIVEPGNKIIRRYYLPDIIYSQQENLFIVFKRDFNRLASQYGLKYLSALENN